VRGSARWYSWLLPPIREQTAKTHHPTLAKSRNE
jgi:hypothetical protein